MINIKVLFAKKTLNILSPFSLLTDILNSRVLIFILYLERLSSKCICFSKCKKIVVSIIRTLFSFSYSIYISLLHLLLIALWLVDCPLFEINEGF